MRARGKTMKYLSFEPTGGADFQPVYLMYCSTLSDLRWPSAPMTCYIQDYLGYVSGSFNLDAWIMDWHDETRCMELQNHCRATGTA
jgi:hypothetical protein